jgi:nickel/cobalt exporter
MRRRFLSLLAATVLVAGHPMGNFSVSHYTLLEVSAKGVDVTCVLDLAEIPTYQLLRDWKLDAKSAHAALESKAAEQAREWMHGLEFRAGGRRLEPKFVTAEIKLSEGAGGLQVARIASTLHLDHVKGKLEFEDHNFAERAGWKEIVIHSGDGVAISKASQGDTDRSKALTEYPADPATSAPPQDLRASVEWQTQRPATTKKVTPTIIPMQQPQPVLTQAATPAPSSAAAQQSPGAVVKGDFLSRMLGNKDIGLGLILIGIAVAFGLGAVHALSPGHGKTIVAAYLVGSRGTMKHAAFLGAMVTFTHTISVFALGLATFFLSKYVVPEKIIPWLGAISGLSIVGIGASLFFKRLKTLRPAHTHTHHHHHHHDHDHAHDHHHHDHEHAHDHHHHHDHDHGPHGHSHVPEGEITMGSLIALGASGGLVPCPSALVLLLSSVALGHVGLGLVLLVAFSLGLAGVLMAIGMLVLYAKSWLPDPSKTSQHPVFRLVPVLSAVVIVCLGLLMTGVSLGWVRPGGLIG